MAFLCIARITLGFGQPYLAKSIFALSKNKTLYSFLFENIFDVTVVNHNYFLICFKQS